MHVADWISMDSIRPPQQLATIVRCPTGTVSKCTPQTGPRFPFSLPIKSTLKVPSTAHHTRGVSRKFAGFLWPFESQPKGVLFFQTLLVWPTGPCLASGQSGDLRLWIMLLSLQPSADSARRGVSRGWCSLDFFFLLVLSRG